MKHGLHSVLRLMRGSFLAVALLGSFGVAFAQGPIFEDNGTATFEHLGYDVDIVGDVDGDGHPDYAATRQLLSNVFGNYVRVYSGFDGTLIHQVDVPDQVGIPETAVDGIGDVDGDGAADLIVGMRGVGAWVVSGGPGTVLYDLGERVHFTSAFGAGVAGVGDIDGDGVPDVAVTDTGFPSNGAVFLFSGANGVYLQSIASIVPDQFGDVVAGIGDIDGDGLGDIAVGNPDFNVLLDTQVGAVFVYTATNLFQPKFALYGNVLQDQFGWSIVGVGDIDGDNLDDFAVGSPYYDRAGGDGEIGLYSGASGALVQTIHRPYVGFTLAGDFDFDGDGTLDVASFQQGGILEVYSSATGAVIYDDFPRTSAELADHPQDLNGDGFVDLVLGQPGSGPEDQTEIRYAGRVSVWSNTLELIGAPQIGTTPTIQARSQTPGQSFLLLASRSQTPFALASVDPADSRSLLLDPAELVFSVSGSFDAQGRAQIPLSIPNVPALVGRTFYGQFVTTPGGPTLIDHVSNQIEATITL